MRNPFAKPRTLRQWLLGSVCWTVACVGGWGILDAPVVNFEPSPLSDKILGNLLATGLLLTHLLLWQKGVFSGWRPFRTDRCKGSALTLLAGLWLLLLLLFQLYCLLIIAEVVHMILIAKKLV